MYSELRLVSFAIGTQLIGDQLSKQQISYLNKQIWTYLSQHLLKLLIVKKKTQFYAPSLGTVQVWYHQIMNNV